MDKKKSSNFTKSEVEVLVSEVESKREILFGTLSTHLTADVKQESLANAEVSA